MDLAIVFCAAQRHANSIDVSAVHASIPNDTTAPYMGFTSVKCRPRQHNLFSDFGMAFWSIVASDRYFDADIRQAEQRLVCYLQTVREQAMLFNERPFRRQKLSKFGLRGVRDPGILLSMPNIEARLLEQVCQPSDSLTCFSLLRQNTREAQSNPRFSRKVRPSSIANGLCTHERRHSLACGSPGKQLYTLPKVLFEEQNQINIPDFSLFTVHKLIHSHSNSKEFT